MTRRGGGIDHGPEANADFWKIRGSWEDGGEFGKNLLLSKVSWRKWINFGIVTITQIAYTDALAGAGVKKGLTYGQTDDFAIFM